MKRFLVASTGLLVMMSMANAEQPQNIIDLIKSGYDIKSEALPYLLLQKNTDLYACFAESKLFPDLKVTEIPAKNFPCFPVK